MRISDWSSDVCSSDLLRGCVGPCKDDLSSPADIGRGALAFQALPDTEEDATPESGASNAERENLHFAQSTARRQTTAPQARSEARRGGQEGVSTCRSRWSPEHYKKNTKKTRTN